MCYRVLLQKLLCNWAPYLPSLPNFNNLYLSELSEKASIWAQNTIKPSSLGLLHHKINLLKSKMYHVECSLSSLSSVVSSLYKLFSDMQNVNTCQTIPTGSLDPHAHTLGRYLSIDDIHNLLDWYNLRQITYCWRKGRWCTVFSGIQFQIELSATLVTKAINSSVHCLLHNRRSTVKHATNCWHYR